ncbi:PRD domain-containing protein [Lachnoclostridium sp. Marseille-P6806]|uniref:PRD domain-containing protein n=1 Tax=Lachnoclostridium sp. Marseille-P6806 TaxID=2364793 RepID=UPI0010318AAE|nr:PRD domain-containing protein [Lachnoclostridium sp. Marseille-P6806]
MSVGAAVVIQRIINNNVVCAMDQNSEIIVSGCGIGFGRRAGDEVEEQRIEKIYRMENREQFGRFQELLVRVPIELLRITDSIVQKAQQDYGLSLSKNILVSVTDHIQFAVERYGQGMSFENALTDEIRSFYPDEYRIGMDAVRMIRDAFGCDLREDEAASIAMHIVSAELSSKTSVAYEITQAGQDILTLLREAVDMSDGRTRDVMGDMVPILKHFIYRVINDSQYDRDDRLLYDFLQLHFPRETQITSRIAEYIRSRFCRTMTKDEKSQIIVFLRKIRLKEP